MILVRDRSASENSEAPSLLLRAILMNRVSSAQPEVPECPLQEFVTEVRLVQEKFQRLIEGQKDIAETLGRAAARMRAKQRQRTED